MGTAGPVIRSVTEGRVRHIVLNRPERLNALNRALLSALADEVAAVRADASVGCVVVTGAGDRAFSAGADIAELSGLDAVGARRVLLRGQQVLREIEELGVPVIAAVNGYALGGGLELALACSLRLASVDATFGLPEARLGAMPGYGGTQRLRQNMGLAPALYMMLTGRPIDAEEAWLAGLLSRPPVASGKLPAVVDEIARELASLSRSTLGLILESARSGGVSEERLRHEVALGAIAISSPDGQEGFRAFTEKRPPRFGRGE
jgi:enoyl-CoA hydratase